MSERPTYSIGIDLGTTNCAVAFVPLGATGGASRVLPVLQAESPETESADEVLPSFLYLPPGGGKSADTGSGPDFTAWVPGRFARRQTTLTPGRVILSAKSWLANHSISPKEAILPAESKDIEPQDKLSPVDASAALLAHLRTAWERHLADLSFAPAFEAQTIIITVPASFDAAAQQATLEAAVRAGYPRDRIHLLEEPQAAFYRFLEARGAAVAEALPTVGKHILVIDIGGGTSDFSLFRVTEPQADDEGPGLERVAVSEHILLGGDNMDLATAHVLEAALAPDGSAITGSSWDHLVARAREIKERALGDDESAEGLLRIAIPGKGSGLLSGTLSAEIPAAQLRDILLDGFYPAVPREAVAERDRSALREWGLPYASDFAVTRYLAEFLREQPPIDAVLFNGGSLIPARIRNRLLDQIAEWQHGNRPRALDNPEPALAVARGAAHYGRLIESGANRIAAGSGHAVFIEVAAADPGAKKQAICVLPRGAVPGEIQSIGLPDLRMLVNQLVRFSAFQSHRHQAKAGHVVTIESEWVQLPPLETEILYPGAEEGRSIPVQLDARMNELGLLQIEVVATEEAVRHCWPLEFNLRQSAQSRDSKPGPGLAPQEESQTAQGADPERWLSAPEALHKSLYRNRTNERLTPARVLKKISTVTGEPPHEWPLQAIRQLADAMLDSPPKQDSDPDWLETWLHLAGFLMRPGFGDERDPARIDALWELYGTPSPETKRRFLLQILILWRRLAGGLAPSRQQSLLDRHEPASFNPDSRTSEHIRLIGALEQIPVKRKTELSENLIRDILRHGPSGAHTAPMIDALGRLLNRAPFHASARFVVPPESVEDAFNKLSRLDWSAPALHGTVVLFLRAARKVENPTLNLPPKTSRKIIARLTKEAVADLRLAPLQEFIPLSRSEQADLYSESLPPGLRLAQTPKPAGR